MLKKVGKFKKNKVAFAAIVLTFPKGKSILVKRNILPCWIIFVHSKDGFDHLNHFLGIFMPHCSASHDSSYLIFWLYLFTSLCIFYCGGWNFLFHFSQTVGSWAIRWHSIRFSSWPNFFVYAFFMFVIKNKV